jgi:transposase
VPAAYSLDLRERVVATGGGVSRRGAAGVFRVSVSTATPLDETACDNWPLCSSPEWWGSSSKALEQHKDWLLALIAERKRALRAYQCVIRIPTGT